MTHDIVKTTMTIREARREIKALPYFGQEKIAFAALKETVRRDPENTSGVVKIMLRGLGATDADIERKTQAFYTLVNAPEDE